MQKKSFKAWFENYWYHNKWPTIIILFFVITFIIGFSQVVLEHKVYDVYTLYAGGTYLPKESKVEIEKVMQDAAEKVSDTKDPKESEVNLQMLVYLSKDRIAELEEEYEKQGEKFVYDIKENNDVRDTFMKQLISGENVMMILDPELYATAEANGALYPIKEVFGRDMPGTNSTGYGMVLKDSGLSVRYSAFAALPENSIICFKKVTHAMTLIGKSSDQKEHIFQLEVAKEIFRGIGE